MMESLNKTQVSVSVATKSDQSHSGRHIGKQAGSLTVSIVKTSLGIDHVTMSRAPLLLCAIYKFIAGNTPLTISTAY